MVIKPALARDFSLVEQAYLDEESIGFCALLTVSSSDPDLIVSMLIDKAIQYENMGLTNNGIELTYLVAINGITNFCPEQTYNWLNFLDWLGEESHEVNQPFATGTILGSTGDTINVRASAGLDAPVINVAYPGDRVTVWESQIVSGYTWFKVAFYGSNSVGWVREDLLDLD
jgi:hypothetical protein